MSAFSLEGRRALVTGANTGIGQAIAVSLAAQGARVTCAGRRPSDEPLAMIASAGGEADNLSLDFADPMAAKDAFAGEGYSILVNNAGIIRRDDSLTFSEEDWDAVMDVNLKALFFLSQAAAGVMIGQGHGKIIHIASMLSFQGGILIPPYTAAKSGVAGLTRALANEWAAKGINVNAIAPGYMATDNTAPLRADPERNPAIVARIPAGAWGEPKDLKGVVVFLASEASSYMHGAIVPVDGGWLAR
jgi:2-deoxy-D-gluconate 3-dehydrogenase